MDQHNPNHWRQMFDRGRDAPVPNTGGNPLFGKARPPIAAPFGYDDGYDPAREGATGQETPPLSPQDITNEAAMALALDSPEYKPWVLQRGRGAMMLHLRRMCPKSGLWLGWQMSYPHLFAVEYVGDSQLSLDFGTRMFMIEGKGLDHLARYLQQSMVLMVQEFAPKVWPSKPDLHVITAIKLVESQ